MKVLASAPLQISPAAQLVALILTIGSADVELSAAETNAKPTPQPLPLEQVFRFRDSEEKHRFVTREEPGFEKLKARLGAPLFLAVVTNEWPSGLVPIFAVKKPHGIELRRRSLVGEENTSEPLFFGLPPEDEPDAVKIAGRWESLATRGADSRNFLVWDLAVDMETVAGRFDQGTEYRVAYITGGTFRSNRLELRVEYLQDKYVLIGDWQDGRLKGDWRRTDDGESGTWQATRAPVLPTTRGEVVRLYEWRHANNSRHYALEEETMSGGWERSSRPLCRVWSAQPNQERR